MNSDLRDLDLFNGIVKSKESGESMNLRDVAKFAYEGGSVRSGAMELGLESFVVTGGQVPLGACQNRTRAELSDIR